MFGVFALIPVIAEAVDRLCDQAEEAERVSSKAYAKAIAISEGLADEAPALAGVPYEGTRRREVTLPGVGVISLTPNEEVALSGDPGSREFRVALATALARRNAGM
jgi:hypothetical protein